MRIANRIVIKAFSKPEDDALKIREGIMALIALEPDKYVLKESKAQGFNEREIRIFEVVLTKVSNINAFLKHFLQLFSESHKDILLSQAGSRLDEQLDYYIRIDKDAWLDKRTVYLTDTGNCFHIRICLAVFPKKRDVALEAVRHLLCEV